MIFLRAALRLSVPHDNLIDPVGETTTSYALGTAKAGARMLAKTVLRR
jgi:hypothetical protein